MPPNVPRVQDLEFIEFYAGKARATLCMKGAGLKCARLDFLYFKGDGNNYFDVTTDAGFALLSTSQQFLRNFYLKTNHSFLQTIGFKFKFGIIHTWFVSFNCRLCIATLLRARTRKCVVLLGMKCSSFTVVNMGTSMRSPCCPYGDTSKPSVYMSNMIGARIGVSKT